MATANQINYSLTLEKKKIDRLNKELIAAKDDIKKLESDFKKARMILIAQAAEKRKNIKKPDADEAEIKKKTGKKTADR